MALIERVPRRARTRVGGCACEVCTWEACHAHLLICSVLSVGTIRTSPKPLDSLVGRRGACKFNSRRAPLHLVPWAWQRAAVKTTPTLKLGTDCACLHGKCSYYAWDGALSHGSRVLRRKMCLPAVQAVQVVILLWKSMSTNTTVVCSKETSLRISHLRLVYFRTR